MKNFCKKILFLVLSICLLLFEPLGKVNIVKAEQEIDLTQLFIDQHRDYYKSSCYKTDILSPWEVANLKPVLEDYNSDILARAYSLIDEMEGEIDSIEDLVITQFLSDIHRTKMPADEDYLLIVSSLMMCDKEYSGIQESFCDNYVEAFEEVLDAVIDSSSTIDLPEINEIRNASNKLKDVIRISGLNSDEFRDGTSKLRQLMDKSITGSNLAQFISSFETELNEINKNAGKVKSAVNFSYDVISELVDYYSYGIAFVETSNEYKAVLKEVQSVAYKRAQGNKSEITRIGTAGYNYNQIYIATTQFIEDMEDFSERGMEAVIAAGAEDLGIKAIKSAADKFSALLIAAIPELEALKKVYESGKSIVDFFSCVDERSAAGSMLMKTAYTASVLNEVVDNYGSIMCNIYNANQDGSTLQFLFGYQDGTFSSVLMFDEAINMYKNAMLFVCEYAVNYENILLEKAVTSDKSWNSTAITMAATEKQMIADINCHKPYLEYTADGVVRYTHVWDNGIVTQPATSYATGTMLYTCKLCGDTRTEIIEKSKVTLQLDRNTSSMFCGDTLLLKTTITGSNDQVIWSSSNKKVASVSLGKVTAKKEGTSIITASVGGVSAACTVTVKKSTITLNKSKTTIKQGESTTLNAVVKGASKKVRWITSNKTIATVSSKGKVTGKKAGTVTITAIANGVSAKCKITVNNVTVKKDSETSLMKKISKKTDKKIIKGYYADYDNDGHKELFALAGEYGGHIELWYASEKMTNCVWKEDEFDTFFNIKQKSICKISSKQQIFVMIFSYGGTSSFSKCYFVENGQAKEVDLGFERLEQISGKDFVIYQSAYDGMYSSTLNGYVGHTWKPYYLQWYGRGFKEYTAKTISQKQFKNYQNADRILNQIKKAGYTVSSIYLRSNNIININVFEDIDTGKVFGNVTLKISKGKVSVVEHNKDGKDIVEKSSYGGIYKESWK